VSTHPLLVCVFVQGLVRDAANGGTEVNDNATLAYMQSTFTAHYTGNRQPVGIYMHPIHLAVGFISTLYFIRNLTDGEGKNSRRTTQVSRL
jgi:hypothetical protein